MSVHQNKLEGVRSMGGFLVAYKQTLLAALGKVSVVGPG